MLSPTITSLVVAANQESSFNYKIYYRHNIVKINAKLENLCKFEIAHHVILNNGLRIIHHEPPDSVLTPDAVVANNSSLST